jgi:hypothetical protein
MSLILSVLLHSAANDDQPNFVAPDSNATISLSPGAEKLRRERPAVWPAWCEPEKSNMVDVRRRPCHLAMRDFCDGECLLYDDESVFGDPTVPFDPWTSEGPCIKFGYPRGISASCPDLIEMMSFSGRTFGFLCRWLPLKWVPDAFPEGIESPSAHFVPVLVNSTKNSRTNGQNSMPGVKSRVRKRHEVQRRKA